jgi:hypothetical protein
MGFLGNNRPPRPRQDTKPAEPSNVPNLGGTAPRLPTPSTGGPIVCPHCGKNTTQPPISASDPVIKMMFEELEKADGLTPWEEKFIEDVQRAYGKYGSLTPKQQATLEKVHDDKVVNGKRYTPGR